jgi:hypothetical protein
MTPLHALGDLLRGLFSRVPLAAVRVIFVLLLVVLLAWVLSLPRSETTPPGRDSGWDANLKLWAAVALLIQIAIYSFV